MHRLKPLKNALCGSKIKIVKSEKNDSRRTLELFCVKKKQLQQTPNIQKMTSLPKSAKLVTMHGLKPLQNSQFGSKIKILKKYVKNDSTSTFKLFCAKKEV